MGNSSHEEGKLAEPKERQRGVKGVALSTAPEARSEDKEKRGVAFRIQKEHRVTNCPRKRGTKRGVVCLRAVGVKKVIQRLGGKGFLCSHMFKGGKESSPKRQGGKCLGYAGTGGKTVPCGGGSRVEGGGAIC